jgi:hypothetical protein
MGAGVTDAQYLIVTQHIFGRRKKGNRYVVKNVVYMRLLVCWGLTEIHHQLGDMSHLSVTRNTGGNQGVQGWQQPVAHPDNNSSGGEPPLKEIHPDVRHANHEDKMRARADTQL